MIFQIKKKEKKRRKKSISIVSRTEENLLLWKSVTKFRNTLRNKTIDEVKEGLFFFSLSCHIDSVYINIDDSRH